MGTYLLGPIKFRGPCTSLMIIVKLKGYLKATTDLSAYEKAGGDDWVEFGFVNNLRLLGGGTFDGQGAASWVFNKCPQKKKCQVLPTSIKFVGLTNTRVRGIKSVNSKFFHISLVQCQNFWASNIRIIAPGNSPNTDGIHLDRSTGVSIHNSIITTGDDCISVGPGSSKIILKNIRCGPGHGISVGSLGRYEGEKDVKDLLVKDCVLTGTTNGVRIKTWENSPQYSSATNMTFDNIVMNQVSNPIIIDQTYCPYSSCDKQSPSKVKIRDINFKNIRGTSASPVAVSLKCSQGVPCENIKLHNVQLNYHGPTPTTSSCSFVQGLMTSGVQFPYPCTA
ncbi:Polygalacturonase protein [Dioscorea alata]|uniref:Polygalacturonase protein n=1 Tax=Dioscorea alata TaxID=55571 RepID=A0ACB7VIT2_DIOAL|nr:Polygalacturonase protein [Dioscorea alata]